MNTLTYLHPEVRAAVEWCLEVARLNNIPVTVTSTTRSQSTQAALRANYERCVSAGKFPSSASLSPGMTCKYPANKPGDSAHEYGAAWDSSVPPAWQDTWNYVRELAGFAVLDENGDPIHAEVPNWRTFREAGLLAPVA